MKKESFLKGAAILGIAGIFIKVMGAFFRIPLGNIIGSEGLGYYQVGYPIFNFLLAFSVAGFPTAISKLIAEKRALNNYIGANQVFKTSMLVLFIISSTFSLALFFGARYFVNDFVQSPKAFYAVITLAPGLFFVSMQAGYRGYFQGLKDMVPTAVSQLVEQLVRVIIGLLLAVYLMNQSVEYAAAGASFGATAGGIAGLGVILIIYYRHKRKLKNHNEPLIGERDHSSNIIKELMRIAIPITIGASIIPLISLLDTAIVIRRLQSIGFSYSEANSLYGQLTGMATTLINLPQVLTVALAMSIVPVIAESSAKNNLPEIQRDTQSAMRISMLIGLPSAVGLAVLSTPIMQLLFPNEPASVGRVLLYLSFSVLFITQIQTMTGILQGLGRQVIPVRNLLVGALFKLIVTYVLVGIPALNVNGAAIGTVMAYLVAASLNYISLKKYTLVTLDKNRVLIKPIIAVIVMAIVVKLSHMAFIPLVGEKLSTVASITIGGIVYGVMLIATKTITREDFNMLPGGGKLIKILDRFGVL
ncbi:putative polysaccharide biosynthesis protein [Alkaliphilus serpentinus]|uniref:Polysaccharide biosynthesis protein n=1 Tax=Alkaliphilus serpentinus TaxID=1482731 RepID=A0A833HQH7_9FIRM|nr:polysaccharide biosynthesis protein [Alkaliphilus serpentinus]KAB3531850.1 polysaccharide biosynthesis protein [Alkaliphilus serpentinus]